MNGHQRSDGAARLWGAALLLVVFLVGGLAGLAVHRAVAAPATAKAAEGACAARERDRDSRVLDWLDLSAGQRQRIDSILERRRREMDQFWEAEGARLGEIVDSTRADVRAVLTPEQRDEYDRLRAEHRSKSSREGRGGVRGGRR